MIRSRSVVRQAVRAALVTAAAVAMLSGLAYTAQRQLSEIVSETVVRKAAGSFIEELAEKPARFHPGLSDAHNIGMNTVWRAHKDEAWPALFQWVKQQLSDPHRLQATYRVLKPGVVADVRAAGQADAVKERLALTLRIFRGEVPLLKDPEHTKLRQAYTDALETVDRCLVAWTQRPQPDWAKSCDPYHEAATNAEHDYDAYLKTQGVNFAAAYDLVSAHEWIQRRRSDGGEALVKAWVDITEDFMEAL